MINTECVIVSLTKDSDSFIPVGEQMLSKSHDLDFNSWIKCLIYLDKTKKNLEPSFCRTKAN